MDPMTIGVLTDAGRVGALCARSDLVVSICPPHSAEVAAAHRPEDPQ